MSASRPSQILDFGKHRASRGQVSRSSLLGANLLRPRNGALRSEAWHSPDVFRSDFPDLWSRFIRRQFVSRDAAAIFFGVTFQTACNWWDGAPYRPSGDKVAMAALSFPEVFLDVIGGVGALRRAA